MQNKLDHLEGFELHPWRCEFRNNQIEREFLHHHLARGQYQLRIALIICSVFYLVFSLTDFAALGYSREALILLMARLLVALTAVAALYLIHIRPFSISMPMLAATATEIVGMAAFTMIAIYRPNEIPWHSMAMAVMLVVVYLFIPNRLIYALGVALASTVIFILLTNYLDQLTSFDFLRMSMLFVLTNLFGAVAARRYHRLWRDEFRIQTILKRQTVRDHLTGCYNRRYLHDDVLDKEISRAKRNGLWLTVILCDIDHFKSVNDSYGHHMGDVVLCTVSTLLQKNTRDLVDYVVRYGGEEFLLLLPDTDFIGGALLAERLRLAISSNTEIHETIQHINLTASFGVASINFEKMGTSITPHSLIAEADKLLYAAKNAGRNLVKSVSL